MKDKGFFIILTIGILVWSVALWIIPKKYIWVIIILLAIVVIFTLLLFKWKRYSQYSHWQKIKILYSELYCMVCNTPHPIHMFCEKCGACLFRHAYRVFDTDVILIRCGDCRRINSIKIQDWETSYVEQNNRRGYNPHHAGIDSTTG